MLLTCDWGRSEVFSHRLPRNGATFDTQQDTFLKIPRPRMPTPMPAGVIRDELEEREFRVRTP
ncbi:MAG: hypothetical protein WKF77_11440 [Planctomycetaceae bacterium]